MNLDHAPTQVASDRSPLLGWLMPASAERLLAGAGASWSLPPRAVRIERVWPRGDGCVVQWSARCGAQRLSFYGSVGISPSGPPPQEATTVAVVSPEHGLRRTLAERVGIHSPDCDPGLPQVTDCLAADGRRAMQWAGLPHAGGVALIGYKPGRRAAFVYGAAGRGPRWVGKTFHNGQAAHLVERHHALSTALARSGAPVAVPSARGFVPQLKLALFSWMDGTPARLESATELEVLADGAAWIHATRLPGLRGFGPTEDAATTRRWTTLLDTLGHPLAPIAAASAHAALSLRRALCPAPVVTLHRDYHAGQCLIDDAGLRVLDLDTLAAGDAAIDLTNLIAHAALARHEHRGTLAGFGPVVTRLLDAYDRRQPLPPLANLNYYLATALVRLGAVHAWRCRTKQWSAALWAAARHLVESADLTSARSWRDA